jgi:hypothetical protein
MSIVSGHGVEQYRYIHLEGDIGNRYIMISIVNVSFVIENNSFFAFDHKKANVSFFSTIS